MIMAHDARSATWHAATGAAAAASRSQVWLRVCAAAILTLADGECDSACEDANSGSGLWRWASSLPALLSPAATYPASLQAMVLLLSVARFCNDTTRGSFAMLANTESMLRGRLFEASEDIDWRNRTCRRSRRCLWPRRQVLCSAAAHGCILTYQRARCDAAVSPPAYVLWPQV